MAAPPAQCRPDGTAVTNPVAPCLSKAVDTPSGSSAANAKTPRSPTRVSADRPGLSYPHRGGARDEPRQRVQPGAGAPPPPDALPVNLVQLDTIQMALEVVDPRALIRGVGDVPTAITFRGRLPEVPRRRLHYLGQARTLPGSIANDCLR